MSSDENIEYAAGSEKDSNTDQEKREDEVFRGVRVPKSVGFVIDFRIIEPVFIDREKLVEVLRKQEDIIVISRRNKSDPFNKLHIAFSTAVGGINECGESCLQAAILSTQYGMICRREPPPNGPCIAHDIFNSGIFFGVCPGL